MTDVALPTDYSTPAVQARYDTALAEVHGLCDGSRRWTMRVPVQRDRDSDLVISDALEAIPHLLAERDRLAAQIAAVRSIHREIRIHDVCGHPHALDDLGKPGYVQVDDIGVVCPAGYQYSICAACCTDGEGQREDCADTHPHHEAPCWPCPTLAALDTTQDGDTDG